MNGSRIALVLGLAGLAGLGLATPGMLGTCERPESACAARPYAPPAAAAAPAAVELSRCDSAVAEEEAPAAAPVACAEPTAQATAQAQALPTRTVLYPVARPVDLPVAAPTAVSKYSATRERSAAAQKQRTVLGKKLASGQLAGGKAVPDALSAKEESIQKAQGMRSGLSKGTGTVASASGMPATGKLPVEKLPPPK